MNKQKQDPSPSPRAVMAGEQGIAKEKLPALYELGDRAIVLRKLDEAVWCFKRAMELDPQSPRPYMGLAQAMQLQGRGDLARALAMDGMRRGADAAEGYVMIGRFYQFDGDFTSAIAAFERALVANPSHGHAQLALALLRKPTGALTQIAELERLGKLASLDPEHRAPLHFALARSYDAIGHYDAAFTAYRRGNALRRAQFAYTSTLAASTRRMKALFDPGFLRERAGLGATSERPVFVVGMMRSGTSLVEQILASHPDVHGHGERNEIAQIAIAIEERAGGVLYPECLATLDGATVQHYAAGYLALLDRDGGGATRNIDKLPHNFEHLGLISLLFPQARIIHCTRNPIDTCLSNYFQDFADKNIYTCDLATIGHEYRHYQRLMAHWEQVIPNPTLRIPYEELVADQEGWSRKAVAFLGLEWDPACLQFHSNARPVFTKSLWQVRQPIYHSSIGRWRHYERHLGPLIEALGAP